jgi:exopolysaccharide biosynthesis polyprenyl glycosylphosphotransferase
VIVVAAPVMILIALLIRLTSAGPVLFAQERVGLNGRPFKMYKFRTMSMRPMQESDHVWTTENDPRRTALGTLLRKTSLDELPQFFNVLAGNMSVVGPRPERPYFVEKFVRNVAHYQARHQLKVGITGWAQVNGLRGDTSISRRIECDLYYLQNWSFMFDVRIIVQTLWAAVFGSNAY